MDHRVLRRRNVARGIFQHGICDPERDRGAVRGSTGDDAVVIVGKHLRFLQSLASARRAAVPVGQPRRHAVEVRDHLLGPDGHLVLGAPREVDQLLRMPERKRATAADMTRVGGCGGVAGAQRVGHRGITDDACPSSVADRLELPVPSVRRQPDFDFDVGVARGLQRRRHAAERGQILHFLELTRGHERGGRDGAVFQRERGKLVTRRGVRRNRKE